MNHIIIFIIIIFKVQTKPELGKWEVLKPNKNADATIIACGERAITASMVALQMLEKHEILVEVINARFVKPLDADVLEKLESKCIVTVEDNMLAGGFGSLINTFYADKNKRVKNFAYPDEFIAHGNVGELMQNYKITGENIAEYILNAVR